MKLVKTNLKDCYLIEPTIFSDNRGWFMESYNKKLFEKNNIFYNFVQDNESLSTNKGTVRGLHLQLSPKAQTKLVRCTRGEIFDVAVDLRKDSETFKKWVGFKLSSKNRKQLLIPKGFAHGFITLEDYCSVQYKVDEYYSKEHDFSIRYDDPDLNVEWPKDLQPILSDKDKSASFLKNIDFNLI